MTPRLYHEKTIKKTKDMLRTFEPQIRKNLRTSQPQKRAYMKLTKRDLPASRLVPGDCEGNRVDIRFPGIITMKREKK